MENNFISDSDIQFDQFLPSKYQEASKIHWTPIQVIYKAIEWLVEHKVKNVLDIGSGVGKFCFVGAQKSDIEFTGIESRKSLVDVANHIGNLLQFENVEFIHANVIDADFGQYDAYYYFNPFCEQICHADWIDQELDFSAINYLIYESYVYEQFNKANIGTKVIKYCSDSFELPEGYVLEKADFNELLQLWIKKR